MTDSNDKKPGARRPLTLGGNRGASARRSNVRSAVVVEKKKKVLVRPGMKKPGASKTASPIAPPKTMAPPKAAAP
jgi:hypothetical protein